MTYDANGNLVGLNDGAKSWAFAYDSANRLIGNGGTPPSFTFSFAYDARNREVKRTIDGVTTYQIYDGWNLIAEYDTGGNLLAKYIHGPNTDEILVKIDAVGPIYYHENGLGSTVALSNASGAAVEYYSYDIYGKPTFKDGAGNIIPASAHGNRFLFTGREWFAKLNLYDYRNRMYSPELGRFLQSDPIRFAAGDINIYRYVLNSPTNFTDPFGLEAQCATEKDIGNYIETDRKVTPTRPDQDPDSKEAEKAARRFLPKPIQNALLTGELAGTGIAEMLGSLGPQFKFWLTLKYKCCVCKEGGVEWSSEKSQRTEAASSPANGGQGPEWGTNQMGNGNLSNAMAETWAELEAQAQSDCSGK